MKEHINYLAEINARASYKPAIATPADSLSRQHDVYYIGLFAPLEATYWTDWGGRYDTLETSRAEIYIKDWMQKAASLEDVINTPFLFYVDAEEGRLYFNCPKHPWLYHSYELQLAKVAGFLHTVKDPKNPSDCYINGDCLPVLLDKPSDDRKLSDPLHGSEIYLTFSVQLENDGRFDIIDTEMYFNGPARLYKSVKENPGYGDFTMIRTGMVESVSVNDKKATFTCAEKFRSLEQDACRLITRSEFPEITEEGAEGKPLPVIFGEQEINMIKIAGGENSEDPAKFLVAEHIGEVKGVYDRDGASLPYARDGLVITASGNASYARITGYAENRIGQIVTWLLEQRAAIPYNGTFWDTAETDAYRSSSPRVNIAVKSGNVRNAVNAVLKSDTAFFIQKNSARFTLRKWGTLYGVHRLESWTLTQQPKTDWNEAQKYFFSTCVVKYLKNERTGEYAGQYLNSAGENEAEEKYNKRKTAEFETCLAEAADAAALADELAARFVNLKAQANIGVGTDTSGIDLLDTVIIRLSVNGRLYSENEEWIARGVNPAQDTMVLAEK